MYSLRNVLGKEPAVISASVIATLNVFVLAAALVFTIDTGAVGILLVAIDTALVSVLSLFVRAATVTKSALSELEELDTPRKRSR